MGDKNNKFFHLTVNIRRERKSITKILSNRVTFTTPYEIKATAAAIYFSNMFKQSGSTKPEMGLAKFNKLSHAQSARLEQPVTIDEVRRAMWDCDYSKALGPGRFTFSFYKTIWLLIGNKVFHMVSEFFRKEN